MVGKELVLPVFIPVHNAGKDRVDVCRGADYQEDDEEERLEVEDRGL